MTNLQKGVHLVQCLCEVHRRAFGEDIGALVVGAELKCEAAQNEATAVRHSRITAPHRKTCEDSRRLGEAWRLRDLCGLLRRRVGATQAKAFRETGAHGLGLAGNDLQGLDNTGDSAGVGGVLGHCKSFSVRG